MNEDMAGDAGVIERCDPNCALAVMSKDGIVCHFRSIGGPCLPKIPAFARVVDRCNELATALHDERDENARLRAALDEALAFINDNAANDPCGYCKSGVVERIRAIAEGGAK